MALKFRLQRFGSRGRPFYHVVVANSASPRDGKFIENVGHYNPMTEKSSVELKKDRIAHWYGVGARPSSAVKNLFKINNVTL